ncbi:MAG: hypothetical protein LBP72_05070 [Dysgonamonadaceae bacterium]|jgi:hypothetical protein|nr:hypothetical protein [Dysgonamonadaceae bacterium]
MKKIEFDFMNIGGVQRIYAIPDTSFRTIREDISSGKCYLDLQRFEDIIAIYTVYDTLIFNLENIDHSLECSGNVPGIVQKLIYGYHADVATWPDEPMPVGDTPMSLEEAATLDDDVVMKAGTRAFTMEFTEDTGSLTINPVGETDGASMEYTLTLVKARLAKKVLGFMNAALGRKMFFIVQDENGVYYLMGNKRRGCTFVTGGDGATTGTTTSDRNQASLQFKFRAGRAFVYEGDVDDILVMQAPPQS